MNVQPKPQVVFFRTETGREPVREWLEKFDEADEQRIYAVIRAVWMDWEAALRKQRVKKLADDLWEIRRPIRKNRTIRVVFTREDNKMVLLHGFVKKSQRIPRKDLQLARKRKDQWNSRRE